MGEGIRSRVDCGLGHGEDIYLLTGFERTNDSLDFLSCPKNNQYLSKAPLINFVLYRNYICLLWSKPRADVGALAIHHVCLIPVDDASKTPASKSTRKCISYPQSRREANPGQISVGKIAPPQTRDEPRGYCSGPVPPIPLARALELHIRSPSVGFGGISWVHHSAHGTLDPGCCS